MLCRWCGEIFRWPKWSCAATRSLREDQALLLRRRLPLVPRAASPHGCNLVAVNDIWVQPLDTCDVLELCVSLIIRGRLAIRLGLCRCSASLTSVSQHGCLVFFGARLSCSPPWTYYCKKLTQNAQVVLYWKRLTHKNELIIPISSWTTVKTMYYKA